jgi:predicted RNase H-like HicB family nuclease
MIAHRKGAKTQRTAGKKTEHTHFSKLSKLGRFTGIFHEENKWWIARCAEVPAAITQGRTLGEAKQNLAGAISDVLEYEYEESLRSAKPDDKILAVSVRRVS